MTVTGFEFVEKVSTQARDGEMVVCVPRGVGRKDQLFAVYVNELRFPDYFGGNWDAFEECLRDLSWLPKGSVVRIVHEGHPFRIDSGELRTYLEILQGVASGAGENTIKVRVQFSRRHQRALERVLSG